MPIVKVKGIPVELGGETFVVPPIALGPLEQLQNKLANFSGDVTDLKQVGVVIDAAHAALRRNYPDLTREQIADMIDMGNMQEVFEAVMDVSGLKRKSMEAAAAPGEPTPGG